MGFRVVPTEPGFAERSARYLAKSGYRRDQIAQALVEELNITSGTATEIATAIAA